VTHRYATEGGARVEAGDGEIAHDERHERAEVADGGPDSPTS
jgi:hypothetical protein